MKAESTRQLPAGHAEYARGDSSFVNGLLPPDALRLPARTVVALLRDRFGPNVDEALDGLATSDRGSTAAWHARDAAVNGRASGPTPSLAGPVAADADPRWLTGTRMIGVNVRTVGSFWRVVHYMLTVPEVYDSVHLLPIWEPGVVGSLYGIASWEINPEFLDEELAHEYPQLDTPERQLRAVVALLHLSGRAVGLDVIPHTDRYSQIVLANPDCFEWLRRRRTAIVDHREHLHEEVMDAIHGWLGEVGAAGDPTPATAATAAAATDPPDRDTLFSDATPEATRTRLLFGEPRDYEGRAARREELISRLHSLGYEPVPATMAPPYRGIEVDRTQRYRDAAGRVWYDYRITRPESMSRVFGPLTRYKFYERLNDNHDWQIDFDRPRKRVFDYFAGHIAELRHEYGFDFMRGDMSHVQMRPEGPPVDPDEFYDPLAYVKRTVRRERPSFGYFAETFLSPPGVMSYGDEIDHLEASAAQVTLGDLQSVAIGDGEFLTRLRRYLDIAATRRVVPCFTVMTGDKDDPRFDAFYLSGNEARLFISLFLPSLPSYTALGFELRDPHEQPAPNEHYTKLYVFHEESGPKATHGPYRFGGNVGLFGRITRTRAYADALLPALPASSLTPAAVTWLLPPDPTAGNRTLAWRLPSPDGDLVFVANTDTVAGLGRLIVPLDAASARTTVTADGATLLFTTHDDEAPTRATASGGRLLLRDLQPGEARIYRITEHS